jgi:hypothetical protein
LRVSAVTMHSARAGDRRTSGADQAGAWRDAARCARGSGARRGGA